jgi:hypothetical protein
VAWGLLNTLLVQRAPVHVPGQTEEMRTTAAALAR